MAPSDGRADGWLSLRCYGGLTPSQLLAGFINYHLISLIESPLRLISAFPLPTYTPTQQSITYEKLDGAASSGLFKEKRKMNRGEEGEVQEEPKAADVASVHVGFVFPSRNCRGPRSVAGEGRCTVVSTGM